MSTSRTLHRRLLPLAATIAAAFVLSSCDAASPVVPTGPLADLIEAKAKWRDQGLDIYTYRVTRACFCGNVQEVQVAVFHGEVTDVRVVGDLTPLPPNEAQLYPTIDGLFDIVGEAITQPAHSLVTSYHPERGFPTSVAIDYDDDIADDEITWSVSSVTFPINARQP